MPTGRRGNAPEAHYELFRDWQRTQTQSSVTALRSPRQPMDVRSCSDAGIIRREALVRDPESRSTECTLSRARSEASRFLLDFDLHGGRQTFPNPFNLWFGRSTSTWQRSCPVSVLPTTLSLAGNLRDRHPTH